jgi:hypothetical protein
MRLSRVRSLLIALGVMFTFTVSAQDIDAHSPKPGGGSVQQRKADKKKEEQKKKSEKAVEKGKKRHMKIQAKNTKKMMKKSKHKSEQWNNNKGDSFFQRLFRKKHR